MDIVEYIKSFPIQTFDKGEMLLGVEQETSTLLVIREGFVKVSSVDEAGNEKLLWIAGRYDAIPTESLFSSTTVPRYFYTAFCDGSAFAVDKKDFLSTATQHSEIMQQVARGLSEHHDDLLGRLDSVEQSNLRNKVLFMLRNICQKFSGADTVHLHDLGLNLTHQDIADMVHASREAVSIELKQLQDEGLVEYSRSTFIVHAAKIDTQIKASA